MLLRRSTAPHRSLRASSHRRCGTHPSHNLRKWTLEVAPGNRKQAQRVCLHFHTSGRAILRESLTTTLRVPSPILPSCPSTLDLHPNPSSLNPQPSTINPRPSTLNPHLSTLNPQPFTLNPQPSALHPEPQPQTPSTSRSPLREPSGYHPRRSRRRSGTQLRTSPPPFRPLQGYLAQKKLRPPITLQQDHA